MSLASVLTNELSRRAESLMKTGKFDRDLAIECKRRAEYCGRALYIQEAIKAPGSAQTLAKQAAHEHDTITAYGKLLEKNPE